MSFEAEQEQAVPPGEAKDPSGASAGPGAPPVIMITLGKDSKGNNAVRVVGPITDKGICYMMLELARDEIKRFHDEAPRIIPGRGGFRIPALMGRKRG